VRGAGELWRPAVGDKRRVGCNTLRRDVDGISIAALQLSLQRRR